MTSSQLSPEDQAEIARRTLCVLDAGEVERFHAEPQVQCQTVGLHSYGVAAILIGMGCLLIAEDRWLIGAAILHDADERRTGDMPFPVKRSSPEMKSLMDKLALQEQMDNLFPIMMLSPRQQTLLKLADMLEGLHWCLSGKERRHKEVSSTWRNAIEQELLLNQHRLEPGETERFWQMFRQTLFVSPGQGSAYSTYADFERIHNRSIHNKGK